MARRGNREENRGSGGGIDLGKIVNAATAEGIRAIVDKHPDLKGREGTLFSYIDRDKIHDYVQSVGRELQDYRDGDSARRFLDKFYKDLAGHVASGELLTEQGKEAVLRYSWQKKARGWGSGAKEARELLDGEKYLESAVNSFRDLYELMKTGDYAKRMPEVAEALYTLDQMKFSDAAVNILYQNGLMDKKKYKLLKRTIRERTKVAVETIPKHVENYVTGQKEEQAQGYAAQKAAAVIFAVLGLVAALFAHRITGNVIGISGSDWFGLLAGAFFLIAGALLGVKKKS